jgi:hypothetical protein
VLHSPAAGPDIAPSGGANPCPQIASYVPITSQGNGSIWTLAAGILRPASLVIFAAFLWTGSFELVYLRMAEPVMLAWDAALCLVFFLQHSGMLRKSFRIRMRKWLPDYWSGVIYTIASVIALMLLVSTWQRSDVTFYAASARERRLLGTILLLALAGVLWGIRSLGDFDAFGIQTFLAGLRETTLNRTALTIKGPYRVVRHPFDAFAIVALWAAPVFTLDRMLSMSCSPFGSSWARLLRSAIYFRNSAKHTGTTSVRCECLFQPSTEADASCTVARRRLQ